MYSMLTPPTINEQWTATFDSIYEAYCQAGSTAQNAAAMASEETDRIFQKEEHDENVRTNI